MIVSASRRTDLPRYYMEWFIRRLRGGFVEVPNPFNTHAIRRVSLSVDDVEAIVFWTRDPRPTLPYLRELADRGFLYLFQVTLTGYPRNLEPRAPEREETIVAIHALSEQLGPQRVIWRYDPILLGGSGPRRLSPDFHRENFASLARSLGGVVRRVIVSIHDDYQGQRRRLREALGGALEPGLDEIGQPTPEMGTLLKDLSSLAAAEGMAIQACGEPESLRPWGVEPGACIDGTLLRELWGIETGKPKDGGQRELCRCAPSVDIGVYDSCPASCVYCYAQRSPARALEHWRNHDPASISL